MRTAIVGTGIAGLAAAHRLRGRHDVVLYERNDYVGGHSHTVDVRADGTTVPVDTGFIVFNERNYPLFTALLDELAVPTLSTLMTFSLRCDRTGLEYNPHSLSTLFVQRRNLLSPWFWRIFWDVGRFRRSFEALADLDDETLSLGEYLRGHGYSRQFIEKFIVPLGAAVWSAPATDIEDFPVKTFATFFRNHGFLGLRRHYHWRTVRGGSRSYVQRLTAPLASAIRPSTPVRSVRRCGDRVEVATDGAVEAFDHVILACHSDEALALLADGPPLERQVLGAIPYRPNDVVLHTDSTILPRARAAWACWNYLVPTDDTAGVTVTYDMNLLQSLGTSEEYCVSLNLTTRLDPSRVVARFTYDHPTYGPGAPAAQAQWSAISGRSRVHFAGAYWGYGFHEDGIRSGYRAADAILAGGP